MAGKRNSTLFAVEDLFPITQNVILGLFGFMILANLELFTEILIFKSHRFTIPVVYLLRPDRRSGFLR